MSNNHFSNNDVNNNNKNKLKAYSIYKKKASERQKQFRLKKRQQGLVELNIWVNSDTYQLLHTLQFPSTKNANILETYTLKIKEVLEILEKYRETEIKKSPEIEVIDLYTGNFSHRIKLLENGNHDVDQQTIDTQKNFVKNLKMCFDIIFTSNSENLSDKKLGELLYKHGYFTYNKFRNKTCPSPKSVKVMRQYLYPKIKL